MSKQSQVVVSPVPLRDLHIVDYSFIVPTLEKNIPILHEIDRLESSEYANRYECVLAHQIGKARCRNIAARESRGEYLIFIDGDSWCSPRALRSVMFWLSEHPNDYLCYPDKARPGACCSRILAISKRQFTRIGGFNEVFEEPMDVEFGIRAKRANIKQFYIPEEWVNHNEHPTNNFIESVRRPYQRIKLFVNYPKECWILFCRRSLKRFILLFFRQTVPFRKHWGLLNLRRFIQNVSAFFVNFVLSVFHARFKSSLIEDSPPDSILP